VRTADVCADRDRVAATATTAALAPSRSSRGTRAALRHLSRAFSPAEPERHERRRHEVLPVQRRLLAVSDLRAPSRERCCQTFKNLRHGSTLRGFATHDHRWARLRLLVLRSGLV